MPLQELAFYKPIRRFMQSYYTSGAVQALPSLTQPTSSFKRHVLFAILGLLFFIVIYIGLMVWFGWLAYDLFGTIAKGKVEFTLFTVVLGVIFTFLSIFMFKSLFIFRKRRGDSGQQVSAQDEPILFDYLNQLADEAGAPRPHRVFLSSEVNAAVFYDLSVLNLLWPTRKNLIIGIGLINVLNLGEFKAVLAHEFGHFAQRSMLLGRYVYIANQIAAAVVHKRDILDKFLAGVSSFDLRVAWIGWILSLLVWAIRSLIQTLFSGVAAAQRALSREMEFQADLVAVSLTGSDALIHALYKLKFADEAYHAALDSVNSQFAKQNVVPDLFTLQSNAIEKMRFLLDDPHYGHSPKRTGPDPAARVFSSLVVNPPEMWSTHPIDNDREENAKRTYIYADIEDRSAWLLFQNPQAIREKVTADLIANGKGQGEAELISLEASLAAMNKANYEWEFLHPKYKGAFRARYTFENFNSVEEVYATAAERMPKLDFRTLYPDHLSDTIEQYIEVGEEIELLESVSREVMTAERRILSHRGAPVRRRDIPEILGGLDQERAELRAQLKEHDQRCRSVHSAAAKNLQPKVAEYLQTLSGLTHYAEHSILDLTDIAGKFYTEVNLVLSGGSPGEGKLGILVNLGRELHLVLNRVYSGGEKVNLDPPTMEKIETPYSELLFEFELGKPNMENLQEWVNAVGGWVSHALKALNQLRNAALEQLLEVEEQVKVAYLQGGTIVLPSEKISYPQNYVVLLPGSERERNYQLGAWDRFVSGDGLVPTVAKFTVSAAMISAAIFVGAISHSSSLFIYNGLNAEVEVSINGMPYSLTAGMQKRIQYDSDTELEIISLTANGDTIDYFNESIDSDGDNYVYNVGHAGYMVEYSVVYGNGPEPWENPKEAPLWLKTDADYVLRAPPASLKLKQNHNVVKTALDPVRNMDPKYMPGIDANLPTVNRMVLSHAKWDSPSDPYIISWMALASEIDPRGDFLRIRLQRDPNELLSLRFMQDLTPEDEKNSFCAEIHTRADAEPDNGDLRYLAIRCEPEGPEQDAKFVQAFEKFPKNTWLARIAAMRAAHEQNWMEADRRYAVAMDGNPAMLGLISTEYSRVHRMARFIDPTLGPVGARVRQEENLAYYEKLESGDTETLKDNPEKAIHLLHNGLLDQAIDYIKKFPEWEQYIKWYAAASYRAPAELIEEVLAYDSTEGITYNNIWIALGLKARHGQSYDHLFVALQEGYGPDFVSEVATTTSFIQAVQAGNIAKAESYFAEMQYFETVVQHQLIGTIILGLKTPKAWREATDNILWIHERPYQAYLNPRKPGV